MSQHYSGTTASFFYDLEGALLRTVELVKTSQNRNNFNAYCGRDLGMLGTIFPDRETLIEMFKNYVATRCGEYIMIGWE